MSTHKLPIGFRYTFEEVVNGDVVDRFYACNLIPQVGINHIAALIRGTGPLIANWYIGLFENNYVPTAETEAADIPVTMGESIAYSEATRQPWVHAYDGISLVDNGGNRAEFTFTSDRTIQGAFLISNSTKGAATGTLFSAVRFPSPRQPKAGTVFRVTAGIVIVPTQII